MRLSEWKTYIAYDKSNDFQGLAMEHFRQSTQFRYS